MTGDSRFSNFRKGQRTLKSLTSDQKQRGNGTFNLAEGQRGQHNW